MFCFKYYTVYFLPIYAYTDFCLKGNKMFSNFTLCSVNSASKISFHHNHLNIYKKNNNLSCDNTIA